MEKSEIFLVPDYYTSFFCKCGSCRSSCCGGWGISLTRTEYYALIGLDCTEKLRAKLDCAFFRPENPTPERFALFNRRYDGRCPLQTDEGLCLLQKECGEKALTSVCRNYPRNIKSTGRPECSCSCSCEGVVELLLHDSYPIEFEKKNFHAVLSDDELDEEVLEYEALRKACGEIFAGSALAASVSGEDCRVRDKAIGIMRNRERGLNERLSAALELMKDVDRRLHSCTEEELSEILGHDYLSAMMVTENADADALPESAYLTRCFEGISDSVRSYGKIAEKALGVSVGGISELTPGLVRKAEALVSEYIGDPDICYEKMLVNDMFFTRFPFGGINISDAQADGNYFSNRARALSLMYSIFRFISLGNVAAAAERLRNENTAEASRPDKQDGIASAVRVAFVDSSAGFFRMAEHTDFFHNVLAFERRGGRL